MNQRTIVKAFVTCGILVIAATTAEAAFTLWVDTPADAVRADRFNDPAELNVRRETLARVPELRQKPTLPLRPEIPEPLETPRLLNMREQPADNDAPVLVNGTPRPVLPVAAPAK